MKKIFDSTLWNTIALFGIGVLAYFTQELVTFFMLGFVIIVLSTIYDKLGQISNKLDNKS